MKINSLFSQDSTPSRSYVRSVQETPDGRTRREVATRDERYSRVKRPLTEAEKTNRLGRTFPICAFVGLAILATVGTVLYNLPAMKNSWDGLHLPTINMPKFAFHRNAVKPAAAPIQTVRETPAPSDDLKAEIELVKNVPVSDSASKWGACVVPYIVPASEDGDSTHQIGRKLRWDIVRVANDNLKLATEPLHAGDTVYIPRRTAACGYHLHLRKLFVAPPSPQSTASVELAFVPIPELPEAADTASASTTVTQ